MTEIAAPPPAAIPPPAETSSTSREIALVVYILYLVPLGVTHIVGLILAYVSRPAAPEWLKTHYTLQIRSFWIGLLYFVIACCAIIVVIGVILVPAVVVWFYIRCAIGLSRLTRNEPYPEPASWLI